VTDLLSDDDDEDEYSNDDDNVHAGGIIPLTNASKIMAACYILKPLAQGGTCYPN